MSVATLLIVILVLALLGGAVPWGGYAVPPPAQPGQPVPPGGYFHGYGWGPVVPGGLGLVLVIVLILVLLGRF